MNHDGIATATPAPIRWPKCPTARASGPCYAGFGTVYFVEGGLDVALVSPDREVLAEAWFRLTGTYIDPAAVQPVAIFQQTDTHVPQPVHPKEKP